MSPRHSPARRAQRGVILFIALIVLVAMSLAGVALMRSVDTNVLIAGNLAFRQATTALGDNGVEAARGWMTANNSLLVSNQPGGNTGYWANWQAGLDFTGTTASTSDDYPWDTQGTSVTSPDPAYVIAYVVHRLCEIEGAVEKAKCLKASAGAGGSTSRRHQGHRHLRRAEPAGDGDGLLSRHGPRQRPAQHEELRTGSAELKSRRTS